MISKKFFLNGLSRLTLLSVMASTLLSLDTAMAADEYTVELYETYCKACHTAAGAGVPVAFDEADWQPRLNAGLEKLVNNAINGVANMPAQGSCMECTYEDFEELIKYMSVPKSE